MRPRSSLVRRARRIRLLVLDVDGVLTDGQLLYGPRGEALKRFDIHDGLALAAWTKVGLFAAVLSGRRSSAVTRRMAELGIEAVYEGLKEKLPKYNALLDRFACHDREVAVMGDDLTDLPLLARAGLAIAPANAVPEVKARAHVVTRRGGGRGAVREAVETILRAQGRWASLVRGYRGS